MLFVICSGHLYAQQKYEKESRIKEKDVPSHALDFIESLEIERAVRWYLEEEFDRTSIEAKFRLNNQIYSFEFDTIGNLEDIEIRISWDDLQKMLKDSIHAHLGRNCTKYKIQKIQIQYPGDRSTLFAKIKSGESAENHIVRYEIIAKCCSAKNVALFEYLFSNTGQIISTSKIEFKNSSNLEY